MDPIDQTVQDSASHGSWAAIAALVVWGSVAVLKSEQDAALAHPAAGVPARSWRFALGQAYAVLELVVHGMPWGSAVVRGVVVAAIAIGGQELGSKLNQAQTAASIAKVAAKIGGAVCNMVDKNDKTARFVCSLVDEGSSVLGNMSTTEAADFHRRTAAHFEVEVPLEQADAFARENGGGQ
jgi:hypothetical protein